MSLRKLRLRFKGVGTTYKKSVEIHVSKDDGCLSTVAELLDKLAAEIVTGSIIEDLDLYGDYEDIITLFRTPNVIWENLPDTFERCRLDKRINDYYVCDSIPQRLDAVWSEEADVDEWLLTAAQYNALTITHPHHIKFEHPVKFRQVFDVVAAQVPAGRRVRHLMLFLTESFTPYDLPWFASASNDALISRS